MEVTVLLILKNMQCVAVFFMWQHNSVYSYYVFSHCSQVLTVLLRGQSFSHGMGPFQFQACSNLQNKFVHVCMNL